MRYLDIIVYHLPIPGSQMHIILTEAFHYTCVGLAPTLSTCNLRLQHARACSLGQASPLSPSEWESPYYFGPCMYICPRLSQDTPSDIDTLNLQECDDKNLGHVRPYLG
jgi:hypothetical protein